MYQSELDQIIKAAGTFDEAIFSLADMVHWQDGALEYFIEQEILKKIKPALEAECDGCEERCVEKVEFVDGSKPDDTRAYIICKLHDDMGPNEVGMEKLYRWKANKEKLVELGYCMEGYLVLWDNDNDLYIPLKDAVNMASDDSITVRKMSKMLEDPEFPVHRMHKGRRCKVHMPEFRKWIEYSLRNITDADIEKYLEKVEARTETARQKKQSKK